MIIIWEILTLLHHKSIHASHQLSSNPPDADVTTLSLSINQGRQGTESGFTSSSNYREIPNYGEAGKKAEDHLKLSPEDDDIPPGPISRTAGMIDPITRISMVVKDNPTMQRHIANMMEAQMINEAKLVDGPHFGSFPQFDIRPQTFYKFKIPYIRRPVSKDARTTLELARKCRHDGDKSPKIFKLIEKYTKARSREANETRCLFHNMLKMPLKGGGYLTKRKYRMLSHIGCKPFFTDLTSPGGFAHFSCWIGELHGMYNCCSKPKHKRLKPCTLHQTTVNQIVDPWGKTASTGPNGVNLDDTETADTYSKVDLSTDDLLKYLVYEKVPLNQFPLFNRVFYGIHELLCRETDGIDSLIFSDTSHHHFRTNIQLAYLKNNEYIYGERGVFLSDEYEVEDILADDLQRSFGPDKIFLLPEMSAILTTPAFVCWYDKYWSDGKRLTVSAKSLLRDVLDNRYKRVNSTDRLYDWNIMTSPELAIKITRLEDNSLAVEIGLRLISTYREYCENRGDDPDHTDSSYPLYKFKMESSHILTRAIREYNEEECVRISPESIIALQGNDTYELVMGYLRQIVRISERSCLHRNYTFSTEFENFLRSKDYGQSLGAKLNNPDSYRLPKFVNDNVYCEEYRRHHCNRRKQFHQVLPAPEKDTTVSVSGDSHVNNSITNPMYVSANGTTLTVSQYPVANENDQNLSGVLGESHRGDCTPSGVVYQNVSKGTSHLAHPPKQDSHSRQFGFSHQNKTWDKSHHYDNLVFSSKEQLNGTQEFMEDMSNTGVGIPDENEPEYQNVGYNDRIEEDDHYETIAHTRRPSDFKLSSGYESLKSEHEYLILENESSAERKDTIYNPHQTSPGVNYTSKSTYHKAPASNSYPSLPEEKGKLEYQTSAEPNSNNPMIKGASQNTFRNFRGNTKPSVNRVVSKGNDNAVVRKRSDLSKTETSMKLGNLPIAETLLITGVNAITVGTVICLLSQLFPEDIKQSKIFLNQYEITSDGLICTIEFSKRRGLIYAYDYAFVSATLIPEENCLLLRITERKVPRWKLSRKPDNGKYGSQKTISEKVALPIEYAGYINSNSELVIKVKQPQDDSGQAMMKVRA